MYYRWLSHFEILGNWEAVNRSLLTQKFAALSQQRWERLGQWIDTTRQIGSAGLQLP